jgi:hypothetical protein
MAAILNLIPADIGCPFRHLAGTIDWPDLSGDAQTVLEKRVLIEREVRCFYESPRELPEKGPK